MCSVDELSHVTLCAIEYNTDNRTKDYRECRGLQEGWDQGRAVYNNRTQSDLESFG